MAYLNDVCWHFEVEGVGVSFGEEGGEVFAGFGGDGGVAVEVGVVDHGGEGDAVGVEGVEGEEGVGDAAESTACGQHHGEVVVAHVVDGEVALGEGHHQSAGSFDEEGVVLGGELFSSLLDEGDVERTLIDHGGEVRGGGVGVYHRGGGVVEVGGGHLDTHDAAMHLDILAVADIAGLHKLLSDHRAAGEGEFAGQPTGDPTLTHISADAGDEEYIGKIF